MANNVSRLIRIQLSVMFLALSVIVLAAAAVLLSFNVRSTHKVSGVVDNGIEYTLHVASCNTAQDAKGNCGVAAGSTFVASVSLDSIVAPYDAIAVTIAYTGVGSKDNPDIVWPDCGIEAPFTQPGLVNAGCSTNFGAPSSQFTGTVFTASFNCTQDGTLSLTHGTSATLVIVPVGPANTTYTEQGPDVLNIDCQGTPMTSTPSATPTTATATLTPSLATATMTTTPATVVTTPTETAPLTGTEPATFIASSTPSATPTQTGAPGSTTTPPITPLSTSTSTPTGMTTQQPTPTQTPTRTPTRTPTPGGLVGDVNCSGGVSAVDAALILQLDAGVVASLPCQQNGRANGDGVVNTVDALLVLQYIVGIIDSLPA